MGRTRLIELLSEPQKLDDKSMELLREALDAYPFFQAGRMLWIKNLHNLDHIRYNSELKLAAAFIPDRSRLFFLINEGLNPVSQAEDFVSDEGKPDDNREQNRGSFHLNDINDSSDCAADIDKIEERRSVHEKDEKNNSIANEHIGQIGDDANYFEVDDSVVSANGELIDFSGEKNFDEPRSNDETRMDFSKTENLTLPSADLLDYEKETYSSYYSLDGEVEVSPVNLNESHSFSEWLNLLRHQSLKEEPVGEDATVNRGVESRKPGKVDLIDSFLNNAASHQRIVPSTESNLTNKDISEKSAEENDELMTETLASIHIKQERYHKAKDIFERLRLKYPEKSVYFARRIEEMKELINNQ